MQILKQFGCSVGHLLEKQTPIHTNHLEEGCSETTFSDKYLHELGLPPGSEAELFNIRPPPDSNLTPIRIDRRKADKIKFRPVFKISGKVKCIVKSMIENFMLTNKFCEMFEILKIVGRGPEPGQLDFPVDATIMPDGSIAVCDKNNMRVQVRTINYLCMFH